MNDSDYYGQVVRNENDARANEKILDHLQQPLPQPTKAEQETAIWAEVRQVAKHLQTRCRGLGITEEAHAAINLVVDEIVWRYCNSIERGE